MLMVISPAKSLDFDTPVKTRKFSEPGFLEHSELLVKQLRKLDPPDLEQLMGISPALATLNWQRNLDWHRPFTTANARQALFAFKGDVYLGMQPETFTARDLDQAQQQLRILSGLYGVLRPLDLMQAYRLEMGTELANPRGKNLYEFWGSLITDQLNAELATAKKPVLVNLASNEYFKAVQVKKLKADVITPVFKDGKNGQYKMISFFAKKARGMMSAFVIRNRISKPEDIKAFDTGGYAFSEKHSKGNQWVFLRDEA